MRKQVKIESNLVKAVDTSLTVKSDIDTLLKYKKNHIRPDNCKSLNCGSQSKLRHKGNVAQRRP